MLAWLAGYGYSERDHCIIVILISLFEQRDSNNSDAFKALNQENIEQ